MRYANLLAILGSSIRVLLQATPTTLILNFIFRSHLLTSLEDWFEKLPKILVPKTLLSECYDSCSINLKSRSKILALKTSPIYDSSSTKKMELITKLTTEEHEQIKSTDL